jgi:serine/threonine protein kinase
MDIKPKKPGDSSPAHPPVGSVLAGRYHLEALIAVGGMGAVFRATDSFLDQPVAIKVLTVKKWALFVSRSSGGTC